MLYHNNTFLNKEISVVHSTRDVTSLKFCTTEILCNKYAFPTSVFNSSCNKYYTACSPNYSLQQPSVNHVPGHRDPSAPKALQFPLREFASFIFILLSIWTILHFPTLHSFDQIFAHSLILSLPHCDLFMSSSQLPVLPIFVPSANVASLRLCFCPSHLYKVEALAWSYDSPFASYKSFMPILFLVCQPIFCLCRSVTSQRVTIYYTKLPLVWFLIKYHLEVKVLYIHQFSFIHSTHYLEWGRMEIGPSAQLDHADQVL